ncbi:MAG: translation initiation factor IF-2, partial [Candidatus Omnitrophica bacterium]|nr:translation initiation factor IF-2 [Candidatus Omnitrophota bacterium]
RVREIFKVSRIGTIAGCIVEKNKIIRNARIRLIRDEMKIYEGNVKSLKRFKDDAKEVAEGYECGIGIENFNDIKVDDLLECYQIEKIARKLN